MRIICPEKQSKTKKAVQGQSTKSLWWDRLVKKVGFKPRVKREEIKEGKNKKWWCTWTAMCKMRWMWRRLITSLTKLIQKLLTKAFRWGLSGKRYDARDLLSDRDLHLFEIACRPYHCLYNLLPPERHVGYDLRDRGHSHELIAHKYKMTRSSFIVRTLFDNM